MRGGAKVVVERHRHEGVFVAKGGKDDAVVTKNLDVGYSVYGEKRIAVEVHSKAQQSKADVDTAQDLPFPFSHLLSPPLPSPLWCCECEGGRCEGGVSCVESFPF